MYKLTTDSNIIQRTSDGAFIPADEMNADYQQYLDWLSQGNEPVPAQSVEEIRLKLWGDIKAERDSRKSAGVKIVVIGEDKWFHSDDPSRIQQLGLVMMGANIPNGLQWKTMDGTFVTMTQALAGQIFQAVATHDVTVFGVAEAHRLAMESSQSPADYDYSTDWPQTFEEWQALQE